MNTFLRNQYAGFRLDDTLVTKIKWTAIVRVWDITFKIIPDHKDRDKKIYTIKDEYGARFGCFNDRLAESLIVNETYSMGGSVRIGKGGTYLNIDYAEIMKGTEYATNE